MRLILTAAAIVTALALVGCGDPASADQLTRLSIVIPTAHVGTPGLAYAAVRSYGVDLDAMVITGKSDQRSNEYAVQRHYNAAIGLFDNIKGTNLSLGVLSVLQGSSFRRVQYGISVRL